MRTLLVKIPHQFSLTTTTTTLTKTTIIKNINKDRKGKEGGTLWERCWLKFHTSSHISYPLEDCFEKDFFWQLLTEMKYQFLLNPEPMVQFMYPYTFKHILGWSAVIFLCWFNTVVSVSFNIIVDQLKWELNLWNNINHRRKYHDLKQKYMSQYVICSKLKVTKSDPK